MALWAIGLVMIWHYGP